jgi:hypothetical protein
MCGDGREMAMQWLGTLERLTAPDQSTAPA